MLKIVLVDDENVVLQGVAHLLNETRDDYVVLGSFQDPKKAETFIRSHAEQIDVVMTDIKMPDMSGVELVQRIRRIRPEIVVIAMSAYTDYEYVRQAMKNGAADYLLKPCRRQEMLDLFYRVEKEKEKREKQKVYEEKTYFLRRYLYGKLNEEKEFYHIWEMGRSIRITVLRSTSGEEKELPEDMRRENPDGIWLSRREILWNFQPEERELLAKPENERFYSASLAAPWILDSIEVSY
ncbi:MAG: response regulator [Lachnospiraceae bacterium]